jgi:ketosteroid isomerase-like protein
VQFSDAQRAALSRYLTNADDLRVDFSDVRVTVAGDEAAVSFTRQDRFVDHKTGETQQVVVRVTKLFAKRADGWQIVPGQ